MNILLLSGFGPSWPQGNAFYDSKMLSETFLDREVYHSGLNRNISIDDFFIRSNGKKIKLFRKRNSVEKNLTTATPETILDSCNCDYDSVDLEKVWNNEKINTIKIPNMIFLSTTYICNFKDLEYALNWIKKNYSNVPIVLGGQFSNLKYKKIMDTKPSVDFIMRFDGEISIPKFIEAFEEKKIYLAYLI